MKSTEPDSARTRKVADARTRRVADTKTRSRVAELGLRDDSVRVAGDKLKGWFDRVLTCGYAYLYNAHGERRTRMSIDKALVLCCAGHTAEHLEETGIADSMRRIMLDDRLLGVGVKQAHMEILGGMMPMDNMYRERNLLRAYELGKGF